MYQIIKISVVSLDIIDDTILYSLFAIQDIVYYNFKQ